MILKHPVSKEMINRFAGIIDFYCWKNLFIARKWPRKPRQPRTPAQLKTLGMLGWIKNFKDDQPAQWYRGLQDLNYPPGICAMDWARKVGAEFYWSDEPPPE